MVHDGEPGAEENVPYAGVHEPWRDWTDVATVTGPLDPTRHRRSAQTALTRSDLVTAGQEALQPMVRWVASLAAHNWRS